MPPTDRQLSAEGLAFLRERHLATFTSLGPDGTPHVTPVGFTWDADRSLARVITSGSSRKARNVGAGGTVALCQADGRRWLTLQGSALVAADLDSVAEAVARYSRRYRVPRVNPARVALEVAVSRIYGSRGLLA